MHVHIVSHKCKTILIKMDSSEKWNGLHVVVNNRRVASYCYIVMQIS